MSHNNWEAKTYIRDALVRRMEVDRTLRVLQANIKQLKQEREGLSGYEKGQITREITPLEAQVKGLQEERMDLPPAPVDPKEAVAEIQAHCESYLEEYEKAKAEFLKRADSWNWKDAIESYSRGIVMAEAQWFKYAKPLLDAINENPNNPVKVWLWRNYAMDNLLDRAMSWTADRCTNSVTRDTSIWEHEAIMDLFGGYSWKFSTRAIERLLDGVCAFYTLNGWPQEEEE